MNTTPAHHFHDPLDRDASRLQSDLSAVAAHGAQAEPLRRSWRSRWATQTRLFRRLWALDEQPWGTPRPQSRAAAPAPDAGVTVTARATGQQPVLDCRA